MAPSRPRRPTSPRSTRARSARWGEGPALPEGRADAGITTLSGTAYLVGGLGPGRGPDRHGLVHRARPGHERARAPGSRCRTPRRTDITLPEPRSGAAVVAVADGIIVAGGRGADGQPTATVWKSTLDAEGLLSEFKEQPALAVPGCRRRHRPRGHVPLGLRRLRRERRGRWRAARASSARSRRTRSAAPGGVGRRARRRAPSGER